MTYHHSISGAVRSGDDRYLHFSIHELFGLTSSLTTAAAVFGYALVALTPLLGADNTSTKNPAPAITTSVATPTSFAPTLDDVERIAPKETDPDPENSAFMPLLVHVIDSGSLSTADEFYRAAQLALRGWPDFKRARMAHELMLTAVAKGHRQASGELQNTWDALLSSVGRPLRMAVPDPNAKQDEDAQEITPAPTVVAAVWRNLTQARATAQKVHSNPEMQAIVDADQGIRQKDWSKFTEAEHKALWKADHDRNRRTREIVSAGALHTSDDFANAALVMQHSDTFAGYELAHELAVCALLLGDTGTGRWLVTATYDRMLGSIGHDQRFGTQQRGDETVDIDERGICDAERQALGCPSLEAGKGDALVRKAEKLLAEKLFAEAEPIARESVVRREMGYPAGAWQIASAKRVHGGVLVGLKRYAEAEPILLEAYDGLKSAEASMPDYIGTRLRQTAGYLAEAYAAMGETAKASKWNARAK